MPIEHYTAMAPLMLYYKSWRVLDEANEYSFSRINDRHVIVHCEWRNRNFRILPSHACVCACAWNGEARDKGGVKDLVGCRDAMARKRRDKGRGKTLAGCRYRRVVLFFTVWGQRSRYAGRAGRHNRRKNGGLGLVRKPKNATRWMLKWKPGKSNACALSRSQFIYINVPKEIYINRLLKFWMNRCQ